MSLILDALRKSEAERRQAQAADDTLADLPRLPASARTGIPAWVWPGVAFAVLATAAAAWLLLTQPIPTQIPDIDSATSVTPATPTPARVDEGLAGPVPDPQPITIAPAVPPAGDHAAATAVQAAARATPSASSSTTAAAGPTTAQAPVPVAAPASPPNAVAVTATPPPVTSPEASEPPASPTASASTGTPTDGATPSLPGAPTRSATGNGVLRLSDLGTADRQQLPALKMSMHMWGPDSSKRFAIIDGNRVGEGDRIGESVVERIDQDGVVLAWKGLRLRVPVR